MRIRLNYVSNGSPVLEQAEINNFPLLWAAPPTTRLFTLCTPTDRPHPTRGPIDRFTNYSLCALWWMIKRTTCFFCILFCRRITLFICYVIIDKWWSQFCGLRSSACSRSPLLHYSHGQWFEFINRKHSRKCVDVDSMLFSVRSMLFELDFSYQN